VLQILFESFDFGVFPQSRQDQFAHADDRGGPAGRLVPPAEQFLPGCFYCGRERPVGVFAGGIDIIARSGGQRLPIRGERRVEPQEDTEFLVLIQAEIAVDDSACEGGPGGLAVGGYEVVALSDQAVDAVAFGRAVEIGASQVDKGAEHLADTYAGHSSPFPGRAFHRRIGSSYLMSISVAFPALPAGFRTTLRQIKIRRH